MMPGNFETSIHQQLFHEGIANLNRRAIGCFFVRKIPRSKARTVNTITPCFGPDINQSIANTSSFTFLNLIFVHDANAHGIDQRMSGIAPVKVCFAANCRNANCIAITANPRDDPINQMLGMWLFNVAKS